MIYKQNKKGISYLSLIHLTIIPIFNFKVLILCSKKHVWASLYADFKIA